MVCGDQWLLMTHTKWTLCFWEKKNERIRTNMSCFRHFILGFTFLFWVPLKSKVTASRGCRNIFVVVAFVCLISGSSLFKFINIRERNNTSEGYTLKDRVKGHTAHGDYRAKPKLGEDDRKCPLENPRQALESHDEFPYCQVGDSFSCVGQQPWVAWKPGFRALLQWGGNSWGHGVSWPPFPNPAAPSMESLPK